MPDAPPPTYLENGNLALEWIVVIRYDPAREVVTLSWNKDGDLYRSSRQGATAFRPGDVPEIQEAVRRCVAMLTDPSLL